MPERRDVIGGALEGKGKTTSQLMQDRRRQITKDLWEEGVIEKPPRAGGAEGKAEDHFDIDDMGADDGLDDLPADVANAIREDEGGSDEDAVDEAGGGVGDGNADDAVGPPGRTPRAHRELAKLHCFVVQCDKACGWI